MKPTIFSIEMECRPCLIDDKKALFHKWEDYAQVIEPSIMIGGTPGGQISMTFGIVEFENGEVKRVEPYRIKFCGNDFKKYSFKESELNSI